MARKNLTRGQAMKAWREEDGATLKHAWSVIGIGVKAATRYESGERVPRRVARAIDLVGIARLYGVPVFAQKR